jgi:hypothetical protein
MEAKIHLFNPLIPNRTANIASLSHKKSDAGRAGGSWSPESGS